MTRATPNPLYTQGGDNTTTLRRLLRSLEQDGRQSQRRLAAELDVAVGLVNIYLKRCVNKGLVKVKKTSPRRYAYFLTPQGLAEKSRLTTDYLSRSFEFFRQAKADCAGLFQTAAKAGHHRLTLAGGSELAEIVAICAQQAAVKIVAVVDATVPAGHFNGLPLVQTFAAVPASFDAVVVTDLNRPHETFANMVDRFGHDRVFAPALLNVANRQPEQSP